VLVRHRSSWRNDLGRCDAKSQFLGINDVVMLGVIVERMPFWITRNDTLLCNILSLVATLH
jgi:hypothetical protein